MPKQVTIQLRDGKGAVPTQGKTRRGDAVTWQNFTSRGRSITFSVWPFEEVPGPIGVAAKGKSATYHIASTATARAYAYVIVPSINPPDGPPDEPVIVVGG